MSGVNASLNFGFGPDTIVQEFYWDEDVEQDLRDAIELQCGNELVDGDYRDMVDGSVIWWRSEDGEVEDLTDLLVDAISNLDNGGTVWVFTPKPGSGNHCESADISEAAKLAGLSVTGTVRGQEWSGIGMTARKRP